MERKESRLNQVKSYLAEDLVQQLLEKQGLVVERLIVDSHGKKLNEIGLRRLLQEFSKIEELLNFLRDCRTNGFLPDFIAHDPLEPELVSFHEVKYTEGKMSFSKVDKKQKRVLKSLAAQGYGIFLDIIKISTNYSDNLEGIEFCLKEQGESLRRNIPKAHTAKLKIINSLTEKTQFENIFITRFNSELRLVQQGRNKSPNP